MARLLCRARPRRCWILEDQTRKKGVIPALTRHRGGGYDASSGSGRTLDQYERFSRGEPGTRENLEISRPMRGGWGVTGLCLALLCAVLPQNLRAAPRGAPEVELDGPRSKSPPQPFPTTLRLKIPYARTWDAVVAVLASRGFPLEVVARNSGVVGTGWKITQPNHQVQINRREFLGRKAERLTVLVRPLTEGSQIDVRSIEDEPFDHESPDEKADQESEDVSKSDSPEDEVEEEEEVEVKNSIAAIDLMFPLGAYGLTEPLAESPTVMFRGATVWTCDEAGTLEHADVFVTGLEEGGFDNVVGLPVGLTLRLLREAGAEIADH